MLPNVCGCGCEFKFYISKRKDSESKHVPDKPHSNQCPLALLLHTTAQMGC